MESRNPLSKWIAYVLIGVMMGGNVSPAYATSHIYIDNSGSGSYHYISGYANTSALYARDDGSASPSSYTKAFTDWVQSPLDDTLTMTGGELRTYGLYQNGTLQATGGNISVNSGSLHIGSSSYINSGANLSLASGATLAITGGSVTLNSGDSVNLGNITATSGSLSFIGGTHTISSGSNIATSFSVSGDDTNVSFTNANSLNTNLGNSGSMTFKSGTIAHAISGTGDTTFDGTVTNTAVINQNNVSNAGTLTNNSAISGNLTNANRIQGTGSLVTGTGNSSNNGTISQSSLTNNGAFTSNGQITLTNGLTNNATFANNAMLLASVNNQTASTLNSDPDHLGDDVLNNGTLNLNADGTLSVEVTGTGTTNINGDLVNGSSISQKDINVATGKVVITNASDMTASHLITNNGIVNYTGGTTANTVEGTGRIDVTGYVTNNGSITQNKVSNSGIFTNNGTVTANLINTNEIAGTGSITTGTGISSNEGTIEQASLTNQGTFDNSGHITLTGALTNNATFNTNADLITAAGGVANTGNLNITGGTNANVITGAGTTNFTNTVTNNGAITQTMVTNNGNLTNNALITAAVTNTGTLTSVGTNIVGNIANTGSFVLSNGNNANTITGTGTTSILGTTTNTGSITQDKVIIGNAGSLTTASNTVSATVENQGDLTWNGGDVNNNIVTGNGDLTISGTSVLNLSSISQNGISVNADAGLTSDASALTAADGLINHGDLTFISGTNNNNIFGLGDLIIQGDVTNNALIEQDVVDVALGKFTTNASSLATYNGIINDSELSFTGGDNNNDITGDGMTYIDGTVQNLANISTKIQVNTGAHYGTATDVQAKIDNRGTTDLIDADILAGGKISGTGTTNILGDTVNNNSITQSAVNIAANGSLTTNSQNVTAAVTNDGTLVWNAGGANANVVSGEGTLNITGGTIANTAAISQNQINITGGSLTSNADLLASVGGINNAATLGITGGTNNNVITGTGTTNFSNTVINTASITQAAVTNTGYFFNDEALITADITNSGDFINGDGLITGTVTNTGNLVSKAQDIDGDIVNNGNYNIVDGENSNDITGTGDVLILGNTLNSGTISQDTITIDTGATFVAKDMGDVVTTTGIDNAGTFEMQAGTNKSVITGNAGTLKVTGNVTNTSGKSITQDNINIATLASFTADAGDLHAVNGITNTGALTLGDGNTSNNISGTGALTIAGVVNNLGNISQDLLTNNGTLTSDASLLAFANGITNSNTLALTGGTNNNVISGTGTTDLTGDVVNYAAITQTTVTNAGTLDNYDTITGAIINTGTIDSIADDLNGTVNNSGTLNLEGGNTLGAITGTGVTNITDDLVNAFTIAQTTVNNSADLTNNAAITANFNNSGTVANNAAITGAISNNGTITSAADYLNGAVTNDGTLTVAGGTTQNTISGSGNTTISADLVANHTINQASVTNDAVLTNNTVITATNINNNGTITGAASDLVGAIANEGTLVFNAASTGASNISGTGDVQVKANTTLTGTNSFTGGTLVDGSTLTVAGQTNLGTSDVSFANNGVLQVTAAGALSNNLLGQATTDDVRVQNDAALTLNGSIGSAADFRKLGAGTMTLAMASNTYAGDTYVDAGTLVGNTQNINNTVNGAAGTVVEFNDTTDADLNEINTLGTFVQSGSAVLNVENNAFTAAQADINAGTFAANRALTATMMNVNGGTLRGKGNITGTVNVNAGGTIAPGNSIDTLTITGDLNLASGSTTAIEINDTPASDKLVVTGATNIAGGANLTVSNENGRYFEWDSFDILESAGNVTGTFTYDGTVSNYDASRINVELDYSDPTKVALTVKRKATDYAGTTIGLPRNASEVAHAMDAVSTGFGGDITNSLLQLEKLGGLNPDGVTLINPESTLVSALNDLDGVLYANSALIPLFNAKTAHVYDRIAKRNPTTGACPNCHDNVWVEYYNQHDKVYSNENSPHFTNNMTGVLVGYDRSSEDTLLGVYAGFGKSDLRQQNDRMDVDDASLGVYGGYTTGDWMFKGTLYGGMQDYHGKRYISFMDRRTEGKYNGVSVGLDLEASYNVPVYSWLNVRPFVGWLNNYSHQQAFAEKGADSLDLHVSGNDQFNSQARLGFELNGKIKNRFSWYGSVAVKQFVGNDYAKLHMDLDLPGTRMEIISNELGRTSFGGQVGASYAITNNWSIFANMDAGVSNRSANCYGNVGVAYTW